MTEYFLCLQYLQPSPDCLTFYTGLQNYIKVEKITLLRPAGPQVCHQINGDPNILFICTSMIFHP